MNRTEQLVVDLESLQAAGLTADQLRSLHHWSERPEAVRRVTFSSTLAYFRKGQELKQNNSAFANRLRFVAERHKSGGLAALIEQALAKYPT